MGRKTGVGIVGGEFGPGQFAGQTKKLLAGYGPFAQDVTLTHLPPCRSQEMSLGDIVNKNYPPTHGEEDW